MSPFLMFYTHLAPAWHAAKTYVRVAVQKSGIGIFYGRLDGRRQV